MLQKAALEDIVSFRRFVETRDEHLAVASAHPAAALAESMLSQTALSLLEPGEQANPPIATLKRYVRLSTCSWPAYGLNHFHSCRRHSRRSR